MDFRTILSWLEDQERRQVVARENQERRMVEALESLHRDQRAHSLKVVGAMLAYIDGGKEVARVLGHEEHEDKEADQLVNEQLLYCTAEASGGEVPTDPLDSSGEARDALVLDQGAGRKGADALQSHHGKKREDGTCSVVQEAHEKVGVQLGYNTQRGTQDGHLLSDYTIQKDGKDGGALSNYNIQGFQDDGRTLSDYTLQQDDKDDGGLSDRNIHGKEDGHKQSDYTPHEVSKGGGGQSDYNIQFKENGHELSDYTIHKDGKVGGVRADPSQEDGHKQSGYTFQEDFQEDGHKRSDYTTQKGGKDGGAQSNYNIQCTEDGHKQSDYTIQEDGQFGGEQSDHNYNQGKDDEHKQADCTIQEDGKVGGVQSDHIQADGHQLADYTVQRDGEDGRALSNYNNQGVQGDGHTLSDYTIHKVGKNGGGQSHYHHQGKDDGHNQAVVAEQYYIGDDECSSSCDDGTEERFDTIDNMKADEHVHDNAMTELRELCVTLANRLRWGTVHFSARHLGDLGWRGLVTFPDIEDVVLGEPATSKSEALNNAIMRAARKLAAEARRY